MADEQIDVHSRLIYRPESGDTTPVEVPFRAKTITMSGTDYATGTQAVGTSEEALDIGEITTVGLVVVENLDTSNYVLVGHADVSAADDARPVRVNAGERWAFRMTGTPYVRANTATVRIRYWIFED